MVPWNRVTRRDVLRAIREYDWLGPDRFFSEHGFGATRRLMTWFGINAVTHPKRSWAQLMSSPRDNNLAPATSKVGRPAL